MKIIDYWDIESTRKDRNGDVREVVYRLGEYRIAVRKDIAIAGGYSFYVKPVDPDSYCPRIYVDRSPWLYERYQIVTIQTTSWGALEVSEISKVVNAYTDAQMIAREIISAFPECFGKGMPE